MKKLKLIFVCMLISTAGLVMTSCHSLKQPKEIPQPLNYSDADIVQAETERIDGMLESQPVRALWRSLLLGRDDIIEKAKSNLETRFEKALEEKDYFSAKKYYKSLVSAGWKNSKYSATEIEKLYSSDIPGISGKNSNAPATIAQCMDATVTVWLDKGVTVRNGAGYADITIGSGFFIDNRGYLITNHHVIDAMVNPKYEGYSRLYVKLLEDPDTKIPAKVVGYDPILDLALLKVEIEPKYVLNLGSSSQLQIGNRVSAIGTPIGLQGTLTSGIVSSTERKLLTLGNVFQIDAAVNSGNSGGPLIDEKLNVQAIVFAGILTHQGLNFAIPVEYLRQELPQLYNGDEVQHAWIASYGHTYRQGNKRAGLEIQYVLPGGSAAMSGFTAGDVITEVDGVAVSSIEDFQFLLMAYEAETLLTCKYTDSQGQSKSKLIYLDKRPEDPGVLVYNTDFASNAFVPLFGMKLIASSTTNKNSYTIEEIIKGSSADQMSFSERDSVEIHDIKLDKQNKYILATIYTRRQKKGFLDISMVLSTSFDDPYYF